MRGMGCGDRCTPFYLRRAKDLAAHTTRTCTTYPGSCKHYPVTFLLHAEREKMTPWVRAFERAYFKIVRKEEKLIQ